MSKPVEQKQLFDAIRERVDQAKLLDVPPDWQKSWEGMPAFEHRDLEPWKTINVHFRTREDLAEFAKLVGQRVNATTRAMWFPKAEIGTFSNKAYSAGDAALNPQYPVYIISKGRWESRLTSKALELIRVPYHIAVEPQEADEYRKVIDPAKVLVLPFSNLGEGSIPARNWVWEHSIAAGARRHWILDDNIRSFHRYQRNLKCPVADGTIFRIAEDFVNRYLNVAIAGFQYFMFVTRKSGTWRPFALNTRIYSCILLDNKIPHRWRGRYNEDTDLSIRVLKDGMCTILFSAFLARKQPTMKMKGGNTDELYQGDGRLKMAESLVAQHPDCVTIVQKWGRDQHQVDYRRFKRNKLVPNPDAPPATDDYGLSLRSVEEGR